MRPLFPLDFSARPLFGAISDRATKTAGTIFEPPSAGPKGESQDGSSNHNVASALFSTLGLSLPTANAGSFAEPQKAGPKGETQGEPHATNDAKGTRGGPTVKQGQRIRGGPCWPVRSAATTA
jgi:hypothetical protein